MGGWAGCLLKCHGEGGPEEDEMSWGGGPDEYFCVDHGKLNVMGKGGVTKNQMLGGGGLEKTSGPPPHCHFKWNGPKLFVKEYFLPW